MEEFPGRRRRVPGRGIVEVFARHSRLVVTPDDYDPNRPDEPVQEITYPPLIIADSTASTTLDALSIDSDPFALKHGWLDSASIAIVVDVPDGVSSNKRAKAEVADSLKGKSNVLYDRDMTCTPHKLHNGIVRQSGESRLVGHLHAITSSWGIASRRQRLIDVFTILVGDELEIFPGPPPESYGIYTRKMVEATLKRRIALVRSRSGETDETQAKRGKSLLKALDAYFAMVNGDVRIPRCHPFDNGNADLDRAEVVRNFVQACVEVGLFGDLTSCTPAKNRWLTCSEVLSLVTAGQLTHRLLSRTWELAFPQWEIPQNVADSDDWHKIVRAKIYRSKLFLCHENAQLQCLTTSLCTIPADHLLQVLQNK
jgi:hypothetical protein